MIALLRWQFELTWSLLDLRLTALDEDDFLWEPAEGCWTVRRSADGSWRPDWVEPEPDPAPVATIGWLTWHIGWWWTEAITRQQGELPPERTDVLWPGSGAAAEAWLRGLRSRWVELVARLAPAELHEVAPYPWQDRPDRTVAHLVGWVNAELMKNTAEIGQLRLLRAATEGR